MPALLTRAVLILLIVRTIAAPVALRPKAIAYVYVHGLALRVCDWPRQRFERFSASSKLLKLGEGKNRMVNGPSTRPPGFRSVWSDSARSWSPHSLSGLHRKPVLLSTHLRC